MNWDRERGEEVMNAFRDVLTQAGIKWQNRDGSSQFPIYRTHFTIQNLKFSVIIGFGSFGYEDYKLELWCEELGDPVGWLSVTDAWEIIKQSME